MPIELMNSWMTLIILFVTHQIKKKPLVIIFWIIVQLFVLQAYYSVAFSFGLLICYAEVHSEKFKLFFSSGFIKYSALIVGIYFASYPFVGYQNSTVNSFYAPLSFFEKYPHIISYLNGDVLLFCFLLRANKIQKLFETKWLLALGKISFQFYLVHLLVLLSFTPWVFHALSSSMNEASNLVLSGLFSFLVVTSLSYLLYRFLDVPMLKFLNRFMKKLFSDSVNS
jgi:peptidoglycan/LPS O-acetylase OafA/YrhL